MSFILVDEIISFIPGERIVAVKDMAGLKEYAACHPLKGAVVPPSLVVEAVAQAAGWLITATLDFRKRGLLLSLGIIEFRGNVDFHDRLVLEAELQSLHENAAMVTGRARAGGFTVGEVDSGYCVLVDAGELEDPADTRKRFEALMRQVVPR